MQSSFQYTGSIHIDRSSPMIIPSLFIIKILNEIKYPWLEKQQAGIVLFTPKPIFLLQTTLSLSRFFSIFFATFFFYHPAPPSSVFLISVLGPTGFLLVSRPLLFFPISSHDERSSSTRVGENCLQLMTSFLCISFLQHECVQMTQVLSKSNFPFQFVITSAYIRRH